MTLPARFNFNVNLTHSEGPCGVSVTSAGVHPKPLDTTALVTFRSLDLLHRGVSGEVNGHSWCELLWSILFPLWESFHLGGAREGLLARVQGGVLRGAAAILATVSTLPALGLC